MSHVRDEKGQQGVHFRVQTAQRRPVEEEEEGGWCETRGEFQGNIL